MGLGFVIKIILMTVFLLPVFHLGYSKRKKIVSPLKPNIEAI